MSAGLLHPGERLLALRAHVALEGLVLGPRGVHGSVHFGARGRGHALPHELGVRLHEGLVEALLQQVALVVGQPRVQELRVGGAQLVDVQAQGLGVAGHDRAVEVVAGALVLLALPLAAGEPDEVRVLVEQVHDVAVRELRWVAHALRRHGLDAGLVGLLRGRVGQHHAPAQLREERKPERVVLVHVERARDAHAAARGFLGRQRLVVEQAVRLVLEEVRHVGRLGATAEAFALLAAIARDEAAVAASLRVFAEIVHREQAGVRAALAAHRAVRGRERLDLVKGQQRGDHLRRLFARALGSAHVRRVAVARQQGRAERAHVARDVRAHGVHFGELLERAQHGVVQERAALHDDLRAHVVRVADLDDLEQRVLDDRDGQAGGDVAHRGAFFLGLLHARVHEHGAAAAQINRRLRLDGGLRELGHVQVQAAREAFDEAAAARRAGLVQHDVVDDAVFHAQAFHVLAANVEDELDARQHLLRAAQVRHRLDLAGVHAQRFEQQALAVAGDRGVSNGHERLAGLGIARQDAVHLGDGRLRAAEHVAFVGRVRAPEQLALLRDERCLERGRARVDAQVGRAAVRCQVAALHALLVMAHLELLVVLRRGEQRVEAHDLGALHVAQVAQALHHVGQRLRLRVLGRGARDGAAGGHEQVRVLGHDDVLFVQVERLVETLAQLRQILQRAAEERHVAADGTAAR